MRPLASVLWFERYALVVLFLVGDCDGELTLGVGVGVEGVSDEVKHAALSVWALVGDEVENQILALLNFEYSLLKSTLDIGVRCCTCG